MFQKLYEALLGESRALGNQREIAKGLSDTLLWDLKGIDALSPTVKSLALLLVEKARMNGTPIKITETFRTAAKQEEYYNQGRKSPGSIITNAKALQSYHQYGLAFDIAFEGVPYPSDLKKWEKLGTLGESIGLVWGGRFNDNPHFEYHPGFDWQDIQDYFKKPI